MSDLIQVDRSSIDALTKQVLDLNKSLRENKLQEIYTEVLDGNEAAQYLKVSKRFLQVLRDKKEIKYIQKDALIRYRKSDLDKWLKDHQVGR